MSENQPRLAVIGVRGLPADLPTAGGGERATEEQASRLALRGYDITVYCRWRYNRRPSSPYKGVRLVSLPSIPTKSLDMVTHSFLATLHVAFANTADIVVYHGMGGGLYVPLARLLGKKTVVGMDGVDWERPKWGRLARFFLRLGAKMAFMWADAVHVDNAAAQRQFGELFGKVPDLITLAAERCGDPGSNLLAQLGLEPGKFVLFVGLLKPDKGVHVLVEAYGAVDTTLPLVIVGDSPDSGDYVEQLKSTPDARVRFLGYVYGPAVQQLYANCLLYVQPSLMEGNSPSLLTAMACGRCVIVSDIEQNLETVGDTGTTFVSEDPQSLAEALTALIHNPQEAERLGGLARTRVETVYNWDTVTDQSDRLYRRVQSGLSDSGCALSDGRAVTSNPINHAIGFWKPLVAPSELERLARYRNPDDPPLRGINAMRVNTDAARYRVVHADTQFSLFAAVHPLDDVPPSAEVVADIRDGAGNHYSYVLWFPGEKSVVVPFDPNAAVDAFWREEYVPPARRMVLPQWLLLLYYTAKPVIPVGLKDHLRRLMARRAEASESFLEWPTDQSLDHLQRLLLKLILMASNRQTLQFAWFWPDRHPWAAVLTHDVETRAGLAQVQHVAEMERRKGLRSSFNLVPLDYETSESVLRDLCEGGFEIGVHGLTHDGLLFSSWPIFAQRVGRINEYGRQWNASGFRSPATYRNQEWFHLLEFQYDSSVSNCARYEPQRGGCASFFPYPVDGLLELPITVPQDHTLFDLLEQTGAETWLSTLQQIRSANGMACVLAHPDPARGYIGLAENEPHYVAVLDVLADSDAWIPLPRDLVRWWRARAMTPPEQMDTIEGISFGTAVLDPSGSIEVVPPSAPVPRRLEMDDRPTENHHE